MDQDLKEQCMVFDTTLNMDNSLLKVWGALKRAFELSAEKVNKFD